MEKQPRAMTIAILAMGGEGGGVLSDWIVDLAEHNGYDAQATSVPGVAQRTGSTIYYVEIFPRVAGKQPVLALMPVPGELDVVIASELMEAGRAVQRGLVTRDRTSLIASTHRVYSMTEKTAMGDGRVDPEKILEACAAASRQFVRADFAGLAESAHSVISAALFGALASTQVLPFDRAQFEDAIRRGGIGVGSSLKAFAAGFSAESGSAERVREQKSPAPAIGRKLEALELRIEKDFPAGSHEILFAGIRRLADYQDERYASEYLDRLVPIRDADRGNFTLLNEAARYLALWMSYEDAIRVADLKIRRERFERIHKEVRAAPGQLLQIREFLHPRAQEIADILPAAIGRRVLKSRTIGRLTKNGGILHTTSIRGFLQLYLLASLRPLRRRSLRFEREQSKMREWLDTVVRLAADDYGMAVEVAECAQILKGYGETRALGEKNFDAIMMAIPRLSGNAGIVKRLCEAALADDTGRKLAEALSEVPG